MNICANNCSGCLLAALVWLLLWPALGFLLGVVL